MRSSLLYSLAAVTTVLTVAAPSVDAAVYTFYDENFNASNGQGVRGPVPPNPPTFNLPIDPMVASFGVDASTATLRNASDFAFVNQSSFQFRDLGGVSGGTPGAGSAQLVTKQVSFFVGTAPFSYLNATFNAAVSGALSAGETFGVTAFVNGAATDSMVVTSNGNFTFDISDNVIAGAVNTFSFGVLAIQNTNSTWSIDNLLLEGAATPEPASMSLLGMGVLAMCGAGYRRRKKTPVAVEV